MSRKNANATTWETTKKHRDVNAHQPPEVQPALVDHDAVDEQRKCAGGKEYRPLPQAHPGERVAGHLKERRRQQRDRSLYQHLFRLVGFASFKLPDVTIAGRLPARRPRAPRRYSRATLTKASPSSRHTVHSSFATAPRER